MCMNNNWKYFKLKELFNYNRGHTLNIENKDIYKGEIPCINGSAENNGILCFLSCKIINEGFEIQPCPSLSLSRVGNSGQTFLQTKPYFIADNAFSLVLKTNKSKEVYLFLSTILNRERFKYSYGRTISIKKYLETAIKLPCKNDEPDWEYMDAFIKALNCKPIASNNSDLTIPLNLTKWKEFKISELFETENIRGDIQALSELNHGNVEVVSTKEINNGVIGRFDTIGVFKNKITVSFNGSCGFFSYHIKPFNANADVGILKEKFILNKYNAMFLITVLNKLSFKYQYGRKLNGKRLKEERILLPVKGDEPDWQFMEDYIKSLPYGDRI